MANETTRRDMLKTSLAVAGLGLLGMPEWALPVMAQGETVVPFTDWPDNFNANPAPDRRLFDTRTSPRRSRRRISSSPRSTTAIRSSIPAPTG